jgi:hypothetical protein
MPVDKVLVQAGNKYHTCATSEFMLILSVSRRYLCLKIERRELLYIGSASDVAVKPAIVVLYVGPLSARCHCLISLEWSRFACTASSRLATRQGTKIICIFFHVYDFEFHEMRHFSTRGTCLVLSISQAMLKAIPLPSQCRTDPESSLLQARCSLPYTYDSRTVLPEPGTTA